MLLRNKDSQEQFHAPSGLGKALIATGAVEEVLPEPQPEVIIQWLVSRGRFVEDYLCPPVISWSGGGNSGYHSSTDGTSHLKCKSYVPGKRQETAPKHIADEYLVLFAQWAKNRKPRKGSPVEHVSAHTPKIPGVGAYTGATTSPWRQNVETRNTK